MPVTLNDRIGDAYRSRDQAGALEAQMSSGAAEAAGVLTAVDEDEEGGEEAEVPRDFEYHSDPEDQGEE